MGLMVTPAHIKKALRELGDPSPEKAKAVQLVTAYIDTLQGALNIAEARVLDCGGESVLVTLAKMGMRED